jgi:hypothetical protein
MPRARPILGGSAREGRALLMALAATFRAIRGRRTRARSEEEDALFI